MTSRLARPAVELGVEDRLPRPEVEPPVGDRQDDLVVDEQVLPVRVAVVLAAAVVAEVAGVGRELARDVVRRLLPRRRRELVEPLERVLEEPGSSSLTQTPAVMCIAETSTMPSATPASSTACWTSSVMRTNSRRSGSRRSV